MNMGGIINGPIFFIVLGPIQIKFLSIDLNPKYAIDILLRAEIALKSTTSLLFSISP
jgi:hypothetical protein